MKTRTRIAALSSCLVAALGLCVGLVLARTGVVAQEPPAAEQLKKLAAEGYETDPAALKAIATGGTPAGRWKEGLTFDGKPMPWLKSARTGTERKIQPDEIRVTFGRPAAAADNGDVGGAEPATATFIFEVGLASTPISGGVVNSLPV
jgi:hypothetical protein